MAAYLSTYGKGADRPSPGVIPLRSQDAEASRANAARKAVQDQEPGSEFTIEIPADLEDCFARLDEIREELGELYNKLYAVNANGAVMGLGYAGPPQKVKMAIQYDMACLNEEEALIQARIYELQWALPPMDENNDLEEDERDLGDPTQPGKYVAGQARDSVTKKLWPDQGRE